jgi:hypothetical protein
MISAAVLTEFCDALDVSGLPDDADAVASHEEDQTMLTRVGRPALIASRSASTR